VAWRHWHGALGLNNEPENVSVPSGPFIVAVSRCHRWSR